MIETKTLKIGEDKFAIQSLPATRALTVAAKLAKVAGGAGKGMSDFTLKIEEISDAFHVGSMVQGVLQNIDADGAPELIRQLVRESLVTPLFEGDGAEQRFTEWYELRFSRELQDLMVLLYEIFAHNYGDPLEWAKKGLARATENGWLAPSVPSSTETDMGSKPAQ